jgi:hypothetical protein
MNEKDIVRLAEEAELWLHTDRKYEAVEKFANSEQAVKTYSGGSGSTHLIHLHGGWCFLKKQEGK